MEIVIDSREHKLIEFLQHNNPNFSFAVKTLDVGDIIVKKENFVVAILERKTFDDLQSSICDGRFKEQKHRLMTSASTIFYILEGRKPKKLRIHKNALRGAILATQIRDQIKILRTENLADTAKLVTELERRLTKQSCSTGLRAPTLTSKRKRMNDQDNILIRQLMCIPKVSESCARAVIEKYSSREELRQVSEADLACVKCKSRKIGKLAKQIKSNI